MAWHQQAPWAEHGLPFRLLGHPHTVSADNLGGQPLNETVLEQSLLSLLSQDFAAHSRCEVFSHVTLVPCFILYRPI